MAPELTRAMEEAGFTPPPIPTTLDLYSGQVVTLSDGERSLYQRFYNALERRLCKAIADERYRSCGADERRHFLEARYRLALQDARRKVLPRVARRGKV